MSERLRDILEKAEREHSAKLLGAAPNSTLEEIQARFRFLSQAFQPDKFSTEEQRQSAAKEFKKIARAYQVLSETASMEKDQALKLLGVPTSASIQEIKERFRFLSHAFHPDKFATEEQRGNAEKEFRIIRRAYEVLSESAKARAGTDGPPFQPTDSVAYKSTSSEPSKGTTHFRNRAAKTRRKQFWSKASVLFIAVACLLGALLMFLQINSMPRSSGRGNEVSETWSQIATELQRAADVGDKQTQMRLGLRYLEGDGVPKSQQEALKWFRKAADQGVAAAQFLLAEAHSKGTGVPVNWTEAILWYRKAAEQGEPASQYILGSALEKGDGVTKDPAEALRWWMKAAYQGNPEAQNKIAQHYSRGGEATRNISEAIKWWRKAADQGHYEAQQHLGISHETGDGVPQDRVEAYKWYLLSSTNNNDYSVSKIRKLLSEMTSEEIAKGRELAKKWSEQR